MSRNTIDSGQVGDAGGGSYLGAVIRDLSVAKVPVADLRRLAAAMLDEWQVFETPIGASTDRNGGALQTGGLEGSNRPLLVKAAIQRWPRERPELGRLC